MPGEQQVGVGLLHRLERNFLIEEHAQDEFGIEQGIVAAITEQLPILVMLYQVVVRVARECERVKAQRIDRWLIEKPQVGFSCAQLRQIERDQVVTDDERRGVAEGIKRTQRPGQRPRREDHGFATVPAHTGQLMDAPAVPADFQIDRQALGSAAASVRLIVLGGHATASI